MRAWAPRGAGRRGGERPREAAAKRRLARGVRCRVARRWRRWRRRCWPPVRAITVAWSSAWMTPALCARMTWGPSLCECHSALQCLSSGGFDALLPQDVHFRVWISDRWHRRHTARLRFPEKSQSPKIPPSLCQRRRNPQSFVRLFYKPPRDAGCGALRGFATRPWACMPQMQYCDRGSAPHGVFARRMRRQTRTTVFPALLTFPTAGCSAAFGGGGAGRPFEVESWRSRAGLRHAARVAPDRPGDQRVVPLRWLQHLLDGAGRERRRRCAPDALQDHRFVGHP